MSSFDENLKKYAELIVKVGLNLRAGQRLIINTGTTRGVPVHSAPLVREVTRAAYKAGARFVEVIWGDEEMLRIRAELAPRDSVEEYSTWHIEALKQMIGGGDALLSISSVDPDLLNGLDPDFIGGLQKEHLKQYSPVSASVSRNAVNWCVVSGASPGWAKKIFPDLSVDDAQDKLWQAIFEATRVDQPDPIKAWEKHIAALRTRANYLQARQYTALKYTAPGTDLTIGLPRGHKWISAQSLAENGVVFTANMPTEEVFTLPDRTRVDGTVQATFPLSYAGTLIEDFCLTFEKGRIVKASAKTGEAALKHLIETDEGAAYLGEVSLVPASSPIGTRGHLFYNTLYDENASCHIAIGRAYRFTLTGGEELTDEEFIQGGGNVSITHVDFMIGSNRMDVDGVKEDGSTEPVLRAGEWVIEA
ncbi:MAG: aminopeptidase [Chloroflexota bacterium]